MERRSFVKSAAVAAAAAFAARGSLFGAEDTVSKDKPFKLKFAPNFGTCWKATQKYSLTDKLQYFYDLGFRALEDNGMADRPVEEQKAIAKKMESLGMEMGVFVAFGMGDTGDAPMLTGNRLSLRDRKTDKAAVRELLEKRMKRALEVAKRVNAKYCTVVPGNEDPSLENGYQFANVVDHLKFCSEICEKQGLVMVLEPLNIKDHPSLFLKRIPQAYAVCKAVGSPSCKILDDLYHQQVTEGNLIQNIDAAWDEIGYFQHADNPGRREPGTGEINYKNVFKHIYDKGYRGILGMEHGVTDQNDMPRLVKAYRAIDLD